MHRTVIIMYIRVALHVFVSLKYIVIAIGRRRPSVNKDYLTMIYFSSTISLFPVTCAVATIAR